MQSAFCGRSDAFPGLAYSVWADLCRAKALGFRVNSLCPLMDDTCHGNLLQDTMLIICGNLTIRLIGPLMQQWSVDCKDPADSHGINRPKRPRSGKGRPSALPVPHLRDSTRTADPRPEKRGASPSELCPLDFPF